MKFLFVLLFALPCWSHQERGGMNLVVEKLKREGFILCDEMKSMHLTSEILGYTPEQFCHAVSHTRMKSTFDPLVIDGEIVQAQFDYKKKLITLNAEWMQIMTSYEIKATALHEHFRAMNLDDNSFSYTYKTMTALGYLKSKSSSFPRAYQIKKVVSDYDYASVLVTFTNNQTAKVSCLNSTLKVRLPINTSEKMIFIKKEFKNNSDCENHLTQLLALPELGDVYYFGFNDKMEPTFIKK